MSLLTKLFSNTSNEKAVTILEDARMDCQYQTIPLKDIKRRATSSGLTGGINGRYIQAWAVHQKTARPCECMVLASNNEGAAVQMRKYLANKCRVNPDEYAVFVGETSCVDKHKYRMEVLGLI